ncbi:hypothetical protein X546_00995 [Brevibacillus borstelensis cifa_chp40]|nr:hypothetical protein X546_00995 [Brevibacillus borstelensis cifa_chp40]
MRKQSFRPGAGFPAPSRIAVDAADCKASNNRKKKKTSSPVQGGLVFSRAMFRSGELQGFELVPPFVNNAAFR